MVHDDQFGTLQQLLKPSHPVGLRTINNHYQIWMEVLQLVERLYRIDGEKEFVIPRDLIVYSRSDSLAEPPQSFGERSDTADIVAIWHHMSKN
jgi:hypothetical protein